MRFLFKGLITISLIIIFKIFWNQEIIDQPALQVINLTENNSEKTLTISKGQIFTLTLSNKVAGGYRFDPPKYDTSILRLEKHNEKPPPPNGGLGNPGQDIWQFTALKTGKTVLKITATRPWAGGGAITIFENIVIIK